MVSDLTNQPDHIHVLIIIIQNAATATKGKFIIGKNPPIDVKAPCAQPN